MDRHPRYPGNPAGQVGRAHVDDGAVAANCRHGSLVPVAEGAVEFSGIEIFPEGTGLLDSHLGELRASFRISFGYVEGNVADGED